MLGISTESGAIMLQQDHHCFEISIEDAVFARTELDGEKSVPLNRDVFFRNLMTQGFRYAVEHNGV